MTSHWNSLNETVQVKDCNFCLVGKQQQHQRRGNMMYYLFVNVSVAPCNWNTGRHSCGVVEWGFVF